MNIYRSSMHRSALKVFVAIVLLAVLSGGWSSAARAESAGGSGGMDRMIQIEPMPVTIIHQGQVKGILMMEFYLEVPDFDEADRVNKLMPRLMDAYRTGLNEFATHELRLDRLINLDRLELYLNRQTLAVLGKNNIHVVFRQIMVQKG